MPHLFSISDITSISFSEFKQSITLGKQWLVIIGISRYQKWNNLQFPVSDGKRLKTILQEKYVIDDVLEIYDTEVTKANLYQLFLSLQQKVKTNDSVLIYYAGHGYYDKITKNSYWIPTDGGKNINSQSNWISDSLIKDMISKISAKHILLISDSCFSGNILNINRGTNVEITIDNVFFSTAYRKNSRLVITSGATEYVPDNSEFTNMLMQSLEKNKYPILDPLKLYSEIRLGVKKSTPLFGVLNETGHQDGGSYLLFLKNEDVLEKSKQITDPELFSEQLNQFIYEYLDNLKIYKLFDLTVVLLNDIKNLAHKRKNPDIIAFSQIAISRVNVQKLDFEQEKVQEIKRIKNLYRNKIETGMQKLNALNQEYLNTDSEFPYLQEEIKLTKHFFQSLRQIREKDKTILLNSDKSNFTVPFNNGLKKISNISRWQAGGIISSIIGSAVLLSGAGLFAFALAYNNFLENSYIGYENYVRDKNLTFGFFFGGLAGMAAGTAGIAVSIPLFGKKKK